MLDTVQSAAVRLTLLGCVACGTTAALSNDVMADDDYSDLTVPSDGIINVLDIAVFESQTAEGLVRAFHKRTKTKPVGVVVPILTGRGVTFDNRLSFPVSAAKRGASNVDVPMAVQELANAGGRCAARACATPRRRRSGGACPWRWPGRGTPSPGCLAL